MRNYKLNFVSTLYDKRRLIFINLVLFVFYGGKAYPIYPGFKSDNNGIIELSASYDKIIANKNVNLARDSAQQIDIPKAFSSLKEEVFNLHGAKGGQLGQIIDETLPLPPIELGEGKIRTVSGSLTIYY